MTRKNIPTVLASMLIITVIAGGLLAQRGPGRGQGKGKGGPGFRGGRQDPTFEEDHDVFHFLLDNGDKIQRQVKNLKNGIETLTESDDPEITAKIQEHVAAMYDRLETNRPIHMRDPLFRELFQHTEKIEMTSEDTEKGIRVVETSEDAHVVKLLQEHAKTVSLFIKNGRAEAHKNHPVPGRDGQVATAAENAAGCCQEEAGCKDGKCEAELGQTKLEGKACCKAGEQKACCKNGDSKKGRSQVKANCKGGECKLDAAQGKVAAKACCKAEKAAKAACDKCQSPQKNATEETVK